jgi:hypothetical protein
MRYIKISKFCELTGYTEPAVRAKIRDGVWQIGREFRKAPDGHVLIDIEGYQQWVEQNISTGFAYVAKKASKSTSFFAASVAGKRSTSPPPLLT